MDLDAFELLEEFGMESRDWGFPLPQEEEEDEAMVAPAMPSSCVTSASTTVPGTSPVL